MYDKSNNNQISNISDTTVINNIEKLTTIAGNAVLSVEGVSSLVNAQLNFNMLYAKEFAKGVVMSLVNNELIFDLYINVKMGSNIPQISFQVQETVKKTVEKLCNKKVSKVNIHVQGIDV